MTGLSLVGIWRFCLIGTACITFLVYYPALFNGFVNWDDDLYVTMNPHLKVIDEAFVSWAFTSLYAGNWHPLTWVSHAFDLLLWGLNPFGHHLTSVILHILNTLVLMVVIRVLYARAVSHVVPMTEERSVRRDREGLAAAVCTGVIFGIHPVHVESVAWVAERKDLLCAFFYLLSCLAYVKYAEEAQNGNGGGSWLRNGKYLLSVALFVAAAMSKAMAVSLPLVLLILDWYPLNRIGRVPLGRILAEKIPFAVVAADVALTAMAGQSSGMSVASLDYIPLPSRIALCAESLVRYLGMLVYPADLSPFYPLPREMAFGSPGAVAACGFVILGTAICIVASRRQRIWLAAWLFFVVTLLPVLGLVKIGGQAVADRYLYLPGIAPILLAGIGTGVLLSTARRAERSMRTLIVHGVTAAVVTSGVCALSFSTAAQIGVWKDSESLWRQAILVAAIKGEGYYRNDYRLYYHLGTFYADAGRYDEAKAAFTEALHLNPQSSLAHHGLGVISYRQGRYDEAKGELINSLKLDPYSVKALNLLGMAYLAQSRTDDAIREFRTALMINPEFYLSHLNLGVALLDKGILDDSIEHLQRACTIRPDLVDARDYLAAARDRRQREAERRERRQVDGAYRNGGKDISSEKTAHPDT